MAATLDIRYARGIHPLYAVLLAATLPPFLGALLSDIAYAMTYQIQWTNFASWLNAGGMVFTGFALLWAFIDLFRAGRRRGRALTVFVLLLVTFALGLVNAFMHARDAWGAMPTGLVLSAIVSVTATLAIWVGFSSLRSGDMA